MPELENWTIGRLLEWTTEYLTSHGADSPRLDAEVLLAEARNCKRIDLYTAFEEEASEETKIAFRELVRRRAEGMPVAYLVGYREFYALKFFVTPDVLIPRPETEFLVIRLLDLAKQFEGRSEPLAIADVGTGSGILSVCAAKHLTSCAVTALDISASAIEIAQRNANCHGVECQIQFLESDLLAAVSEDAQFDFVVSNPPYVSTEEYRQLPVDVRDYEPREALVAGPRARKSLSGWCRKRFGVCGEAGTCCWRSAR